MAIALVYAQATTFEFTRHDDQYYVTENPVVLSGLNAKSLTWAFTSTSTGAWMPVTWLSHMLDVQLFGLQAGWHHLVNVFIHAINSVLLYLLLLRCTSACWRSALVAALFALHPLHVESVAWIAERRDVLSSMWALLTILAYCSWVTRRTTAGYFLVMICFAAALMSKSMIVTVPLMLLLFDIWPLNRLPAAPSVWTSENGKRFWRLVIEKVPLFTMSLVVGSLTIIFENRYVPLGTLDSYPMTLRVGNALVSYAQYLFNVFWPVGLIAHYPYPKTIPLWQYCGAGIGMVVASAYGFRKLGEKPYLVVGWLWYLLTLLPVIGLIQQGADFARADRYTYMPLIGIFIVFVWGGAKLVERFSWSYSVRVSAVVAILLSCGLLSVVQASHWRNTETLFSYVLAESPGNHVALQQLGVEYRERGEFDRAYGFLAEDVGLNPENIDALANFGQLLDRMGRLEEAIEYHRKAISIAPYNSELHLNLGQLLARKGDLSGALASSIRALELQPDSIPARFNLGYVYYLEKNYDLAAEQFSQVLRVEPQSSDAYNGLGLVAMARGRLDEATDNFNSALRLNPALQPARNNLQEIQKRRGQS